MQRCVRRKYFELRQSWAGQPEDAVIVDRARCFLAEFADYLEKEEVHLESAASANVRHIRKVERRNGVWRSMFARVVRERHLTGKDEAGRLGVWLACSGLTVRRNASSQRVVLEGGEVKVQNCRICHHIHG